MPKLKNDEHALVELREDEALEIFEIVLASDIICETVGASCHDYLSGIYSHWYLVYNGESAKPGVRVAGQDVTDEAAVYGVV